MEHANAIGFEISPEGVGIEGGVILIRVNDGDDAASVTYHYTDIYVLTVLADRLVTTDNANRPNQARDVITALHGGTGHQRIPVPFGASVRVRSPDCLLSIGGFHSTTDPNYAWWGNIVRAYHDGFRTDETPQSAQPDDVALTASSATRSETCSRSSTSRARVSASDPTFQET
jgi:hypothetical protein